MICGTAGGVVAVDVVWGGTAVVVCVAEPTVVVAVACGTVEGSAWVGTRLGGSVTLPVSGVGYPCWTMLTAIWTATPEVVPALSTATLICERGGNGTAGVVPVVVGAVVTVAGAAV